MARQVLVERRQGGWSTTPHPQPRAYSAPRRSRLVVGLGQFPGPRRLFRPVEHHPDREVLRELVVAVRRMRRGEHHVARSDDGFAAVPAIARGARCNDVEFVAIMRHLWAGGWPRRKADPNVVVAKHLGGAAPLGRLQRASGGKRHWRWRAIHPRSPLAGTRPVLLLSWFPIRPGARAT